MSIQQHGKDGEDSAITASFNFIATSYTHSNRCGISAAKRSGVNENELRTMKTKLILPTFLKATVLGVALATLTSAVRAQPNVTERIGIYDSRAVAVAYAGSSFQQAKMDDLVNQQKKAKTAGDKKAIARIEAEGRAWQAQLHQQGFSTAPVDDLLEHISNELPKIKADAGVTQLISKWNEPELRKHAGAEKVDVTMKLVDAFHPTERQRQHAIEIQKKKPAKLKE